MALVERLAQHSPMNALKVFIVEDSSIIRDNLTETMRENAPVDVVGSAVDEASAVAWLKDGGNRCDLVIVDLFLKSGNGLGVLREIGNRTDPPASVVLSNHATPEVRAKCLELGATKVFDKSNEIDELLVWLKRLAGSDRAVPASHS